MKVFVLPKELAGEPDLVAMLQAYYSRSHVSIDDRLREMMEGDSDPDKLRESLKKWYIGYGHVSIGDCGSYTVFVEGVSFLTAKAIQDTNLFKGQESSTRFINFMDQPRPSFLPRGDDQHDYWMSVYRESIPLIREKISKEQPELTEKAVSPKAFDAARGLLPVTALTQTSWHGDIRTLRDHLARLLAHPIRWVQADAEEILVKLQSSMPGMFDDLQPDEAYNDWFIDNMEDTNLFAHAHESKDSPLMMLPPRHWQQVDFTRGHLRRYGTMTCLNVIDYGGYRDVQRHRAAYIKAENPLEVRSSFALWYLEQFPDSLRQQMEEHEGTTGINPLMTEVDVSMTADLPQYKYMIDMRTKPTVHATVRKFYTDIAEGIEGFYPNIKAAKYFKIDRTETDWSRRAKQDIVKLHEGASAPR